MHEYQAEEEFVRTMMVLHPRLLLDVNKHALALKHLGLTPRQLVVLGISKRAMEAAGINTAQLEPRWEPPDADNPQTAEAYHGKVHGTSITGYAAPDQLNYVLAGQHHTKERYIIAELPQYLTKTIPWRRCYRVRFRLDKDLKDTSSLIAGVVDQDTFKLNHEQTWDDALYKDIYGLRCLYKKPNNQGWHLNNGPFATCRRPAPLTAPFGVKGDKIDIVIDDAKPHPKFKNEFQRRCQTFINEQLLFEQVVHDWNGKYVVPIVMAQEVDITLESVDELPTSAQHDSAPGPALRL